MTDAAAHREHFESVERQAQASRLGMWVFLASETLLFAGLFALYAINRQQFPEAYAAGVAQNDAVLGTLNTTVLIVSSGCIAAAVHRLRDDATRAATVLAGLTMLLGCAFLVFKGIEYHHHVAQGMVPGSGQSPPRASFVNLYYVMTGLHALHVAAGIGVIGSFTVRLWIGRLRADGSYRLEVGALYWHMVDAIWIFLWPMFYLMHGSAS